MSSATYRNQEIDWESIDVDDLDFEDYISAYGDSGVSASYLNRPLPDQARKDREIREYREGTLLEPLNYVSDFVRMGDGVPDYEDLLEEEEVDLDHLDAEGYGDDALEDYEESLARLFFS